MNTRTTTSTYTAPTSTNSLGYPSSQIEPIAPQTTPELTLRGVSFFGRALAEYMQFFALTPAQLRGRKLLDVAAGPSSFTAEASMLGCDAVAVDPLYGCTVDALSTHVEIDYREMHTQLRSNPQLVRLHSFASIDEAEARRRAAAIRFLDDYKAHFVHGRYVGGALPTLPFEDGEFDTVLCAHLLFVYAAKFDFGFHLAACRELVRVSRGDVRIHPVIGKDGNVYPKLDTLRTELRRVGIESELASIDYEYFAGTDSMLLLRATPSRVLPNHLRPSPSNALTHADT